ncbi:MAG: hypothetical protein L0211_00995 [Planctomycetaceae bacterium]|nr:hypothetical protein [Planctomycetaceae bacterium]
MRQSPRRADRVGHGGLRGDAQTGQIGDRLASELIFPAEQNPDAGNV